MGPIKTVPNILTCILTRDGTHLVKKILLIVDCLMYRMKIGHLHLDNTIKSVMVNSTNIFVTWACKDVFSIKFNLKVYQGMKHLL